MANPKGIQWYFNKHFVSYFLIWAFLLNWPLWLGRWNLKSNFDFSLFEQTAKVIMPILFVCGYYAMLRTVLIPSSFGSFHDTFWYYNISSSCRRLETTFTSQFWWLVVLEIKLLRIFLCLWKKYDIRRKAGWGRSTFIKACRAGELTQRIRTGTTFSEGLS